jgi:hypothetical protein
MDPRSKTSFSFDHISLVSWPFLNTDRVTPYNVRVSECRKPLILVLLKRMSSLNHFGIATPIIRFTVLTQR